MYDRILVPTDGSDQAGAAVDTAFELCSQFGADIYLITVVDAGPLGSIRLPGDATSATEALSAQAEETLADLHDRAETYGIDIETVVRTGTPVREILDYADAIDADLIVIGSRGRGGIDRMLLGSVAEGVTRVGDIDTLIVD